jgi:hypothetical protein
VTRYVTHISAVLIVIDLRAKENRDRSSSLLLFLLFVSWRGRRGARVRVFGSVEDCVDAGRFSFPSFFFFFFVVIIINFFSLGLFIFEMPAPILSSRAAIFLQRPFLEILFYFCLAFYCPFFLSDGRRKGVADGSIKSYRSARRATDGQNPHTFWLAVIF